MDLLYDPSETEVEIIKTAFPHAKFKDASDDIKGYRLEVDLPEEDKDKYLRCLIRNKLAGTSFMLEILMRTATDKIKKLVEEELGVKV